MKLRDFIYKFGWIFAVFVLLINLIFAMYLPANVVTQWSSNGAPTTHMPKIFFIFFLPALEILIYVATRSRVRLQLVEIPMPKIISAIAYIVASLLLVVVDIIIIFMNL